MRRFFLLPFTLCIVAPPAGCAGVSQSRYDSLQRRAARLENRARWAENRWKQARRKLQAGPRCSPAKRNRRRPATRRAMALLKRRALLCEKMLQATRRPLVLANHTREQDIGRGRRRASTVTLRPGTVVLPLKGRRAQRNKRTRRAERRLQKAIGRRLSTLAGCYHRRMARRKRPPRGAVSFAFQVTRAGRIRRISVVHRLLRDPITIRCVVRGLKRLRLPRQRHALWAVFPLEFHTGRAYASGSPMPPR